ncbi:hypothetical protein IWQ62_005124, partial [Dispira parvispora]
SSDYSDSSSYGYPSDSSGQYPPQEAHRMAYDYSNQYSNRRSMMPLEPIWEESE